MAVAHTILQTQGNNTRSAMSLVDMDGETSFPIGTVMSLTVVTTTADGTDVDASAAITLTTAAVTDKQTLMEQFIAELNDTLTGASAHWTANSDDEYVVHVEARPGTAWYVSLSVPTFDNTPE